MDKLPKLGQRVNYQKVLVRRGTRWVPHFLKEPREGIVTGIRTLNNGIWDFEGGYPESYRTSRYYEPREFFQAIYVTHHLRRNHDVTRLPMLEVINE